MSFHVRWMIRRDLADVLEIERRSFARPCGEDVFRDRLRRRNVIGMVAERGEWVVGYMVYELHRDRIELARLAVADDRRREGAGRAMIDKLKGKLRPGRRTRIVARLDEDDATLGACLFLAAMGFRATLERGRDHDVYRFEHGLEGVVAEEAATCSGRLPWLRGPRSRRD